MLYNLKNVYEDTIKDLYSAESQIARALPKMAKAASHPDLKKAFEQHLEVTRRQIERLEKVCQQTGVRPRGKKCVGMEGLLREGEEILQQEGTGSSRDAALIVAAQKVEHYEIVGYGSARAFAERLGFSGAARLLQQTLEEESRTDERLTSIAERNVNAEADETMAAGARKASGSRKASAGARRGRGDLPLAPPGRTRGAALGRVASPGKSQPAAIGRTAEMDKGRTRTTQVRSNPPGSAAKLAGQAGNLRDLQNRKRTASPEEVAEAGRAARGRTGRTKR